jgi:hypothetical protein
MPGILFGGVEIRVKGKPLKTIAEGDPLVPGKHLPVVTFDVPEMANHTLPDELRLIAHC